MHYTVTDVLGIFKARYHTENALLLTEFQVRLKPYDIEQRAFGIILPELYHCERRFTVARFAVAEADRFHRTVCKRHISAACHRFNGHAALEDFCLFELVQRRCFRCKQGANEIEILKACHRTVEIIVPAFIARCAKNLCHVERFERHDRRGGIEEVQAFSEHVLDRFKQGTVRQGTCRDDRRAVRYLRDLFRYDLVKDGFADGMRRT